VCLPVLTDVAARLCHAQEVLPAPSPVLDPNQAGNIDLRLQQSANRLDADKKPADSLPIIRLSGFFQLDDGLFSQPGTMVTCPP
jgi:hypothetical protein